MGQQLSFLDWIVAQAESAYKAVSDQIYAEADADERGVDYEDLDHEYDQMAYTVEYAKADWA